MAVHLLEYSMGTQEEDTTLSILLHSSSHPQLLGRLDLQWLVKADQTIFWAHPDFKLYNGLTFRELPVILILHWVGAAGPIRQSKFGLWIRKSHSFSSGDSEPLGIGRSFNIGEVTPRHSTKHKHLRISVDMSILEKMVGHLKHKRKKQLKGAKTNGCQTKIRQW